MRRIKAERNMQSFLFIIVMGFASIENSSDADSNLKKQNVNNGEVYIKKDDNSTTEKQKETENLIIKRIYDQLSSLKSQKEAAGKVVDSVKLIRVINTIDYTFANGARTFETFKIDSNKIIRYVRFKDESKRMTDEERMFCYHSKKNPESYVNVSKDVAAELARKALFIIYGEKEAVKFDSIEINEDEGCYHI